MSKLSLHRPPPRRPDRRRSPGQRGMTIVELMIGLVILMILTTLAVPGVAALLRSFNLRSAADDVVYAASLARTQAASGRRAFGLRFKALGGGNAGLWFDVVRGTGTACSTLVGGAAIYESDYRQGNARNLAAVAVKAFAPSEVSNPAAMLCFKPDGRVLRADTGLPFSPPGGTTLAAGDVVLELQRISDENVLLGTAVQVQIAYNGAARVTYARPIGQLQGGGQ